MYGGSEVSESGRKKNLTISTALFEEAKTRETKVMEGEKAEARLKTRW